MAGRGCRMGERDLFVCLILSLTDVCAGGGLDWMGGFLWVRVFVAIYGVCVGWLGGDCIELSYGVWWWVFWLLDREGGRWEGKGMYACVCGK